MELSKSIAKLVEFDAKKSAQPFITNNILQDLVKSQTPKWVNYSILIIAIITLIVTVLTFLK